MAYTVKEFLDILFEDAEEVMQMLSDQNGGEFTSQQFIKHVAQKHQVAYVQLLNRCLEHPEAIPYGIPFNIAHQHMGGSLSAVAKRAGYEGPFKEGQTETTIFGDPTDRVVYRKPD